MTYPAPRHLPTGSDEPAFCPFDQSSIREVRHQVADAVGAAGFGQERSEDFTLAVNEAMTNSVFHAGGTGEIAYWCDGDTFLCEVRDHGHIDDPLMGTVPPTPEQTGGRGLWLMNHLCDLVQIRPTSDGQVVRLHLYS